MPLHSLYVPSEPHHLCIAAGRVPALSGHTAFPGAGTGRALCMRYAGMGILTSTALQVQQQPMGLRVPGMLLGTAFASYCVGGGVRAVAERPVPNIVDEVGLSQSNEVSAYSGLHA